MALTKEELINRIQEFCQRCGELRAEINLLNGDEDQTAVNNLKLECGETSAHMSEMIKWLSVMLIKRYEDEYDPPP